MVYRRLVWTLLVSAALIALNLQSATAQDEAVAAAGPPLNIALFLDSRSDRCYSNGYVEAARSLSQLAANTINARGGVNGRPIVLKVFDNRRDPKTAIANIREAFEVPELLAMIGLRSSTRSTAVFDALGDEFAKHTVPFISHISVGAIFEKYPHVFSTRPAQEVERVPVMARFIEAMNYKKVTFIGRSGARYVDAIDKGLQETLGPERMGRTHRIKALGGSGGFLDGEQMTVAIEDIKRTQPDMLVLAVGTSRTDDVIEKLIEAQVTPQIFLIGRFSKEVKNAAAKYPAPIFGMTWAEVPEVESDRILNVLSRGNPDDWIFEGRRVGEAPGWQKGLCQPTYEADAFSPTNLRAVRVGALYADMVKLVATSASRVARGEKIEKLRAAVLDDLGRKYTVGRGAFAGTFENWSFHSSDRVRAQTPFITILPQGLGRAQLAPSQFVRVRNGKLKQIETLYLDVDLIRIYSVDNNAKSFFAEFYLSMRATDRFSIDDIAFTNAFIDPSNIRGTGGSGRQIALEVLHPGGESDAYPRDMRIYKVSGRFRFTPDFSNYPFDVQQFSIDLQAKSGDKTFIIQPPPPELRDRDVASEGWIPEREYVSFLEDFVPVVDAFTHTPSIVPFYNTRYVWQLKRETTDYYIRVIVPLAFILIVAYLSIFIPKAHLEAIATIQVTALLAAVALYLSLPQIDTDTATISDRIFMFDYMMVSVMIIVSILRINARVAKRAWLDNTLSFLHIVMLPIGLLVLVLYTTKTDLMAGFADMPIWRLMGIG